MLELIFKKLLEYFPQVAVYAIIILIVGFVVYKATRFYVQTKNVHKEFPDIKLVLQKIDKGLNTLNTILLEKSVISQSCYSNGNSPRIINDLGKKVLEESTAGALFEKIKNDLLMELSKNNFTSLLEVERESLNLLLSKMNEPQFSTIQNFAYQHPTFNETPLSYSDILFVMSIKLRDLYKENHPELSEK